MPKDDWCFRRINKIDVGISAVDLTVCLTILLCQTREETTLKSLLAVEMTKATCWKVYANISPAD
jgi:predicted butyrate kinase (DUF1464 family)